MYRGVKGDVIMNGKKDLEDSLLESVSKNREKTRKIQNNRY